MAKSWFYIRIYNDDGTPLTTRCEQAETPEEACKLAFGVVYNHQHDTAKYKNIGTRKPRSLPQYKLKELDGPDGWFLFTRPVPKKKPTPAEFDPAKIAREVEGHLQDAVGDIASDMISPGGGCMDDHWAARITACKKRNKGRKDFDLHGWLADELYNDKDTIRDTIGDRIYEACNGDPELENKVLDLMMENTHDGMRQACQEMKDENLKELAKKK